MFLPACFRQMMTCTQAIWTLERLARRWDVPVPRLLWSNRPTNGLYRWARQEIAFGPRVRAGDQVLFHEFAHHLDAMTRAAKPTHGKPFCRALLDVLEAWDGPPVTFYWQWEYPTVRKYALTRRIVETSHGARAPQPRRHEMARDIRDEKSRRRTRRAHAAEARGKRRNIEQDRASMLAHARNLEDWANDSDSWFPEDIRRQAAHIFRRAGTL